MPHDHPPHPRQHAFLWLNQEEALYGGAAGGGKSDALLMAALQYVDIPGYAAILFRRTFADLSLPGALIPRSKLWLSPTDASWDGNTYRWTFPSGATLSFGYLQTQDDHYRYQGAEFQFIGIDELTQIPELQYRYLASRLRRPDEIETDDPLSQVPLRLRSASNPGGRGHAYVKRRFITKQLDPKDIEDTAERAAARVFVPARLADNPSLDQEAYRKQLAILDPQTRLQLLSGDWNAREPGDWVFPTGLDEVFALGAEHRAMRDAGTMPPPVGSQLILCADWGVHSHLLLLWPLEGGGFHVAREVVYEGTKVRLAAAPVAAAVDSLRWPVHQERFDASMPGLNEAFLEALGQHMARPKFKAIPFNKFKKLSIDYLSTLVHNVEHQELPVLSIDEAGCPVLADQIRQWKYADADAGRIEKGDDHGPDALVAGVAPEAATRGRLLTTSSERTPVG